MEPGSPPGPSRGPSLCRQGRGLLPQVTDLPVQPDHLPADLPLALRAGHALSRGLRARGRLRLPGPHLPGREEPLRAPGPVFLLPPWPLPGGGGGGSEAGGALVGVRAGTEGLGEPAALPGPTEPRGLRPPTAPLTSPSLTASAGTGGCSACRSCCSARVSGRRPGWGRSPRPAAAELRWPLRPTGCAAPKVHVDCSNLTALAIRNPRPVSCQTLAAGYVRAGAGRVPGRGRRAPRGPAVRVRGAENTGASSALPVPGWRWWPVGTCPARQGHKGMFGGPWQAALTCLPAQAERSKWVGT